MLTTVRYSVLSVNHVKCISVDIDKEELYSLAGPVTTSVGSTDVELYIKRIS